MIHRNTLVLAAVLAVLGFPWVARAEEGATIADPDIAAVTAEVPSATQAEPKILTAAILEFEAKDKELQGEASALRDLVDVYLSMNEQVKLVSRVEMEKILAEHGLGLSGLVEESAPRIGYLLGAQVLIAGRVFEVNGKLLLTGRIIGTETGRTYGEVVRGDRSAVDEMAQELADKLGKAIVGKADTLVAKVRLTADQIKQLRKKLGAENLPRVFVSVREQIVNEPVIDPAAQTEIQYILVKSGFEVVKDKSGALKRWTEEFTADGGKTAPPRVDSVDLILVGEGFSQFATRKGELVSYRARVELEAIDPKTGKILAIDRETFVAVDLSEQVAGKTAIQEAAARLAFRLIPEAVQAWRTSAENRGE